MVRFDKEIKLDPETQRVYEKYYQLYRSLYPCLRSRYAELVALP